MQQFRQTTTRNCLQCNKVFHPAISEVKRGNGKFCSLTCVCKYRNLHYMKPRTVKLEIKICQFCRRKFQFGPNGGLGKFCSLICANNGKRGRRPGRLQQNIRRKLKAIAFERYGEKCEVCGYALAVDVHHLIPRAEDGNDEMTNLAVLCPNHHREVHLGLLTKDDIRSFRRTIVEMEGNEPSSRKITLKTSTSLVNL